MALFGKKLTEAKDLDSDTQRLYKDMVLTEIKKKIAAKIDVQDKHVMKTIKVWLMDDTRKKKKE